MTSPIFVRCETCGGEGRRLESYWVYEHGCGFPHPDVEDCGRCEVCDGTGEEEVEGEPITLDDLDEINASLSPS